MGKARPGDSIARFLRDGLAVTVYYQEACDQRGVRLHRRLVNESSDRSQAEVYRNPVYDLDARKMHKRVYGTATGLSAAICVGISHSFAAVDRKEVSSCLVFHNRRRHPPTKQS